MKLTGMMWPAAIKATLAMGFPTRQSHSGALIPITVSQCRSHLDSAGRNKLLFYSGISEEVARQTLAERAYLSGYKLAKDLFNPATYYDDYSRAHKGNPTAEYLFWSKCSQAAAEMAEGVVYVLLPNGEGRDWAVWLEASYWARQEFAILCEKPTVTRLYRLSATDGKMLDDLTSTLKALRAGDACPEVGDPGYAPFYPDRDDM